MMSTVLRPFSFDANVLLLFLFAISYAATIHPSHAQPLTLVVYNMRSPCEASKRCQVVPYSIGDCVKVKKCGHSSTTYFKATGSPTSLTERSFTDSSCTVPVGTGVDTKPCNTCNRNLSIMGRTFELLCPGTPPPAMTTLDGGARDDPHFDGLQGETYDVQGEPNKWFNILSDYDVQINAFFGLEAYNHNHKNATYMFEVGMIVAGDVRVYANASSVYYTEHGRREYKAIKRGAEVDIIDDNENDDHDNDGKEARRRVKVSQAESGTEFIVYSSGYVIRLRRQQPHRREDLSVADVVPYWNIQLHLSDGSRQPHGLLGQTAHHHHNKQQQQDSSSRAKSNEGSGEIEGSYKDYEVSSAFASDFVFNRFEKTTIEIL